MELKELVLSCRNVDDIYEIFKIYFKVTKKVARKPITEKKTTKDKRYCHGTMQRVPWFYR